MKSIIFEACPDGNTLHSEDMTIQATVEVPEGASEDYGYLAMKDAIIAARGSADGLHFWYDGQEQYLDQDANDGDPYVCIEEEDE